MEAVRAFNNELSSLYETRPPVSRAKMANLTKAAIKAIKFYKHVVQSVEKFIQKCKPEYKVPGLYVIDSIVRQSRHQFGAEKDVFAPRFTKNIIQTFQQLFKCPTEERSKIVRVLNLWQKNGVFQSAVIQPLLDLAPDPTDQSRLAAASAAIEEVTGKAASANAASSNQDVGKDSGEAQASQTEMLNTVTQLLQQTQSGGNSAQQQLQQLQLLQQQLIQQTTLMQQSQQGGPPIIDNNLLSHIQTLTNQLLNKGGNDGSEQGFNKKLLDFDYGESDEEDQPSGTGEGVQNILTDPSFMQQVQQVSQSLQFQNENRQKLLQQQEEFDQQIGESAMYGQAHSHDYQDVDERSQEMVEDEDFRQEQERERTRDRDRDRKHKSSKHSKDRSRSRTPKRRRRSRSRSRDKRRRSRSRDRHRRSRSRDRERDKQREKERERRKKGLPALKDECLSICTTTIFIGHIAKQTSEEELKTEIEKYGPVESINLIPPRGCAFVCMKKRKDASKAVDRLKGYKINGSDLRTAWAPGIGVKESEFKDYWDVDTGATYVPWSKIPADVNPLLQGGIIDEDSVPEHLKGTIAVGEKPEPVVEESTPAPGQQISIVNPPMPPPTQMGVPPSTQFPPIPGMLPPVSIMQQMGTMPPMMVPGTLPPSQIPGAPPVPVGIPPPQLPGQPVSNAAMIPLPGGLPVPRPQLTPTSAVTGISLPGLMPTSAVTTGVSTIPGSPALRLGFQPPVTGFPPRFNMPPGGQGFRMPMQFDPTASPVARLPGQPNEPKASLLGPPPFDPSVGAGKMEQPSLLGTPNKPLLGGEEGKDNDKPSALPNTPIGGMGPRIPFSGPGMPGLLDQPGANMGRGGGGPGMMRMPGPGMGPNFRGPRPLMDMEPPRAPFMSPMGPRGFQGGPGGMRFMGNRPGMPGQNFPGPGGNFGGRPNFQGPPGDMNRPPLFDMPPGGPRDDVPPPENDLEDERSDRHDSRRPMDGERKDHWNDFGGRDDYGEDRYRRDFDRRGNRGNQDGWNRDRDDYRDRDRRGGDRRDNRRDDRYGGRDYRGRGDRDQGGKDWGRDRRGGRDEDRRDRRDRDFNRGGRGRRESYDNHGEREDPNAKPVLSDTVMFGADGGVIGVIGEDPLTEFPGGDKTSESAVDNGADHSESGTEAMGEQHCDPSDNGPANEMCGDPIVNGQSEGDASEGQPLVAKEASISIAKDNEAAQECSEAGETALEDGEIE